MILAYNLPTVLEVRILRVEYPYFLDTRATSADAR